MTGTDGVAFYNRDGIILQSTVQPDETFVELAFTFLDLSRNDQLLISIAALHQVFTEDRGVDYVFSSWTLQRCVMRAEHLDRDAQRDLIDDVVGIRARMGLVYRLAEEHFYVDGQGGPLSTDPDPALEPYRVTEGFGQAFVEALSREYRATTPRPETPHT